MLTKPPYALPAEHATWFTHVASGGNLAVLVKYVPLLHRARHLPLRRHLTMSSSTPATRLADVLLTLVTYEERALIR
jgi:hypothetical protein